MPERKRSHPKLDALREHRTLNPRPEGVTDELFHQSEFFDPRDLLQVKYEMIRRVRIDEAPIADTADAFGLSRPSFYEAQAAFTRDGLAGLLPRKRGPREAHKLNAEVMSFIQELRAADRSLSASAIPPRVKERFGLDVHPRSIERALQRQEKKRR
jgi:transposase